MGFDKGQASGLLAECHRRCCICHRFCGVKMELHHIDLKGDGGADDISNAIPVCFNCHAEIASYNDKHPRGRKYSSDELRKHKEQWLEICRTRIREVVEYLPSDSMVGPLQALVDEIEFNLRAVGDCERHLSGNGVYLRILKEAQFDRAIEAGALSVLDEELKSDLIQAYMEVGSARKIVETELGGTHSGYSTRIFKQCAERLKKAHETLMEFLGNGDAVSDTNL